MESLVTVSAENLTSTILSGNSTMAFADVLTTTVGPRAMRQLMSFNNQTVADKVPPDMLHLIDPHWSVFYFAPINIPLLFAFAKSISLRPEITGISFHLWIQCGTKF